MNRNILKPYIRFFVLDNGTNHITVFTTKAVSQQLKDQLGADYQKFDWLLKEDDQSIRSFIQTISGHVKQKSSIFSFEYCLQ